MEHYFEKIISLKNKEIFFLDTCNIDDFIMSCKIEQSFWTQFEKTESNTFCRPIGPSQQQT